MNLFTCPICHQPLALFETALRCSNAHGFDLSREGYVNLLPSHHRQSLNPGDSSEMISARKSFMSAGHFEPLANALLACRHEHAEGDSLADLGCGEGYFSAWVAGSGTSVYGVDISKPAIRTAAKQYKMLNLAIASVMQLPFADQSFDTTMMIMAPYADEAVRILKEGGKLLRVSPGPLHLQQLKKHVYKVARPHERAQLKFPRLTHRHEELVSFDMNLDSEQREHLVSMTPMLHRTSAEKRALLTCEGEMIVTGSFYIDVFEKVDPWASRRADPAAPDEE